MSESISRVTPLEAAEERISQLQLLVANLLLKNQVLRIKLASRPIVP
jgi:hypothetical protein